MLLWNLSCVSFVGSCFEIRWEHLKLYICYICRLHSCIFGFEKMFQACLDDFIIVSCSSQLWQLDAHMPTGKAV